MRLKLRWIIGLALVMLLGACSVLRIGYSQAPNLAYWWIDGHADLNSEQSLTLREGIDRWFDWHRRVELPRYAALLERAQREVMEPMLSPDQVCTWRDEAQRRLDAAFEEGAPALATLLLSLTPEQIGHIERKMAKDGDELKKDFAQTDKAERTKASFKRTLERYENLYGKLDDAQRARLAHLLAASPFDAERWLVERERRNADLLALLTKVSAEGKGAGSAVAQAQAQAAVRLIAERALRSPRPDYRAYQQRLTQANCALAAAMHNATTPAQRQVARNRLKGWEDDVRLIAAGSTGNGNGESKTRSP